MRLSDITIQTGGSKPATPQTMQGLVVAETFRESSGLTLQRLATPVVAGAERRVAQFSRGREFVPRGMTPKELHSMQKTNSHHTMLESLHMQLDDLAKETSPLQRSARRRSLLAKIDTTKALSDAEKSKFRAMVEQVK